MKNFIYAVVLLAGISLVSCKNDTAAKKLSTEVVSNPTTIKFDTAVHDFGKIKEGQVVTYSFKFTNTGKNPLVIASISTSCGCTTPSWSKEPVKPGDVGYVEVQFNSAGKNEGHHEKLVTMYANTDPSETRLTITADIVKKD